MSHLLLPLQNATAVSAPSATSSFEWISSVLTLALVIVTAIMAWETRKVAKETLEVRLAEYEPIIKTTLGWIGPIGVSLKVQNVGKGVAKNIKAKISQLPEKTPTREWFYPLLAPREYARLPLDSIYFKELVSTFHTLKIAGECVDVLNRKHPINDVIDLTAIQKSIEDAPQLLETTLEEHIEELTSKTEEAERDLKDISERLRSGVVVMTYKEAQRDQKKRLKRSIAWQTKARKAMSVKAAQLPQPKK